MQALQAQTSPSASYLHEISTPAAPEIDFSDPQAAFATKTSRSLLKSLCTLQACRVKPLVHNASSLLKFSRACLGQRVTDSVVEATFFNHFCAGKISSYTLLSLMPKSSLREMGCLPEARITSMHAAADVLLAKQFPPKPLTNKDLNFLFYDYVSKDNTLTPSHRPCCSCRHQCRNNKANLGLPQAERHPPHPELCSRG